jgi:predicted nucleic acid-binding protein
MRGEAPVFVDTNFLVYAFDSTDPAPVDPDRALATLDDLAAWPVVANDFALVREAILLSRDAALSFWDALIVAAARSGAATLYTEDLNDGQVLRGVLVVNPFTAQAISGA